MNDFRNVGNWRSGAMSGIAQMGQDDFATDMLGQTIGSSAQSRIGAMQKAGQWMQQGVNDVTSFTASGMQQVGDAMNFGVEMQASKAMQEIERETARRAYEAAKRQQQGAGVSGLISGGLKLAASFIPGGGLLGGIL